MIQLFVSEINLLSEWYRKISICCLLGHEGYPEHIAEFVGIPGIGVHPIQWNHLILKKIFYNFAHEGLFLGFIQLLLTGLSKYGLRE